jgi:hypothetical protein
VPTLPTDDLAGHVDEPVTVEEHAPLGGQALGVDGQQGSQALLDGGPLRGRADQVPHRDDHGRLGVQAGPALVHGGEAAECSEVVSRAGLRGGPLHHLALATGEPEGREGGHAAHVDVRVPDTERVHAGELAHGATVRADGGTHDAPSVLRGVVAGPTGDLQTDGQPLHVPLPRSGQCLVEVVDAEDEVALG